MANRVQEEDEPEEGEIQDDGSLEDVSSAEEVTPSLNQKYKRSYQDYRLSFQNSYNYKHRSTISRQNNVSVLHKRKSRSHNSSSTDEDKIKNPSINSYHVRLKPLSNPEHDTDVRYEEQLVGYISKEDYKEQVPDIAQEKENRQDSRDVAEIKKTRRKRRYSLLQVPDKKPSSTSDTDNEIEIQRKNETSEKKSKEHDPKLQKKTHIKKKSCKEIKEKHHSSKKKPHKSIGKKYCTSDLDKLTLKDPSFIGDHVQENSLKKRLETMLAVTNSIHSLSLSPKAKDNDQSPTIETKPEEHNLEANLNHTLTSDTSEVQDPREGIISGKENVSDVEILEIPKLVIEVITLDDSDGEIQCKITGTNQKLVTGSKTENVEHEIEHRTNDNEGEQKEAIDEEDNLLELRRLALESNKHKEVGSKKCTSTEVDDVLELRLNALRSAYLKKHMERKQRGLTLKQKPASSLSHNLNTLSPLNSPNGVTNSEALSIPTEFDNTLPPPPTLPLPDTPPLPPEPAPVHFPAFISSPPPLPPHPPTSAVEKDVEADETTAIIDMDLAHTDDEQSCESLPALGDGFIVISDSEAHEREVLSTLRLTQDNVSETNACERLGLQEESVYLKGAGQVDSSLLMENTWNSLSDTYKYSEVHPYSVSEFNQYPKQYDKSNDGSLGHHTPNSVLGFSQEVVPQDYFLNQHQGLEHATISAVSFTCPYFVSTSEFTLTTKQSSANSGSELNIIPIISRPIIKPAVNPVWKDVDERPNLRSIPVNLQETVLTDQEIGNPISGNTFKSMCAEMEEEEGQCPPASDSMLSKQHLIHPQEIDGASLELLPETIVAPFAAPYLVTSQFNAESVETNSSTSMLDILDRKVNHIPIIKPTDICWNDFNKQANLSIVSTYVQKSLSANQDDFEKQQNNMSKSVSIESTLTESTLNPIEEPNPKCDNENEESHIEPEIDLSSMIVLDEVGPCSSPEEMMQLNDVCSDVATQEKLKAIQTNLVDQLEVDNIDDDEQILRARVLTSLSKKNKKVASLPVSNTSNCIDPSLLINKKPLPKSQKVPKHQCIQSCTIGPDSAGKEQLLDKLSRDTQSESSNLRSKSVLRKQRILSSTLSSNHQNKKLNVLRSKSSSLIPRISKSSLQVTIPTNNGNKLGRKRKVATHAAPNQRIVIRLGEDTDSGEDDQEQKMHNTTKRRFGTDSTSSSSTPPKAYSPLISRVQVQSGSDSEMSLSPSKMIPQHLGDSNRCVSVDFEKRVDMLLKQVRLQQEEVGEKVTGYRGLKPKTPTIMQTTVTVDKKSRIASSATPLGIHLLPSSKQEEYRRLKQQLALKEKQQQLNKKYSADEAITHRNPGDNRTISMSSCSPTSIKINVANNMHLPRKQVETDKREKCKTARPSVSITYDNIDTSSSVEKRNLYDSSNEGEKIIGGFPSPKKIEFSSLKNVPINIPCDEMSVVPTMCSVLDQFSLNKEVGTLMSSVANCEDGLIRNEMEDNPTKYTRLLVNSSAKESDDIQRYEISEIKCTVNSIAGTAEDVDGQVNVQNNKVGMSPRFSNEKHDCERMKTEVEATRKPTQNPLKELHEAESSLLTQRYSVLDDLTEMMQQLRQLELERSVKTECVSEVRRLRSELVRAEERLMHQNELMLSIRIQIGKAHQRMVHGRRECAMLNKSCMELGTKRIGCDYKVPSGGAELMKTKLQQFANYTRNVNLVKKKGGSPLKLRKLNSSSERQSLDGSSSSGVVLLTSMLKVGQANLSSVTSTSSKVHSEFHIDMKNKNVNSVDDKNCGTFTSKQCSNISTDLSGSERKESCSNVMKLCGNVSREISVMCNTESCPEVTTEISERNIIGACSVMTAEMTRSDVTGPCSSGNTQVADNNVKGLCLDRTKEVPKDCATDSSELEVTKEQVADCFLTHQFHEYRSPLEHMKSKKDESGSSKLDPHAILCPYDLMGSCRDDECLYLHQDTA